MSEESFGGDSSSLQRFDSADTDTVDASEMSVPDWLREQREELEMAKKELTKVCTTMITMTTSLRERVTSWRADAGHTVKESARGVTPRTKRVAKPYVPRGVHYTTQEFLIK